MVCGCPLDSGFPSQTMECSQFCCQPKVVCFRHYCWEKLRRAEIDQEKLNLVRDIVREHGLSELASIRSA